MSNLKLALLVLFGVPTAIVISLGIGAFSLVMINVCFPIAGALWMLGWIVRDTNPSAAISAWTMAYFMNAVFVAFLMRGGGDNPAYAFLFPILMPIRAVGGFWDVVTGGPERRFYGSAVNDSVGSPAAIMQAARAQMAAAS